VRSRLSLIPLLLVGAACVNAVRAPASSDPDASAAEHRQAAAEHERRAAAERERGILRVGFPIVSPLDEDASDAQQAIGNGVDVDDVLVDDDVAAEERALAQRHREAAAALERATDEACVGVADRDACPLAHAIASATTVEGGVHVRLRRKLDRDVLEQHARCHMAVAREENDEGGHRCPLTLAGVEFEADADGQGLTIVAPDAATAEAIRTRAAR
jgi:hypothetical protein